MFAASLGRFLFLVGIRLDLGFEQRVDKLTRSSHSPQSLRRSANEFSSKSSSMTATRNNRWLPVVRKRFIASSLSFSPWRADREVWPIARGTGDGSTSPPRSTATVSSSPETVRLDTADLSNIERIEHPPSMCRNDVKVKNSRPYVRHFVRKTKNP